MNKKIEKIEKKVRSGDKALSEELILIDKCEKLLQKGNFLDETSFSEDEIQIGRSCQLLTVKPIFYIANISDGYHSDKHFKNLKNYAESMYQDVIPVQIKLEEEISVLDETEKKEFLLLEGIEEPALNKIIRKGFKILGLETFFTAGPNELRAWTINKGSLAPQAAGKIHTDFERGFIKAETISFNDFISLGGESAAKENGKLRLEGKDYVVKDGDIINFKFNV